MLEIFNKRFPSNFLLIFKTNTGGFSAVISSSAKSSRKTTACTANLDGVFLKVYIHTLVRSCCMLFYVPQMLNDTRQVWLNNILLVIECQMLPQS